MSACLSSTYTKIGMLRRRLAWPSLKDDAQIHRALHILILKSQSQLAEAFDDGAWFCHFRHMRDIFYTLIELNLQPQGFMMFSKHIYSMSEC